MARSKIEWLARPGTIPESWNPIVGCSLCSEGCRNCYAKRMTHRLGSNPRTRHIYAGLTTATQQYADSAWEPIHWTGEVRFIESVIERPLHWKKPRTVFVCSMGDIFHLGVQVDWVDRIFWVMKKTVQHTYCVLTKRSFNALTYFLFEDVPQFHMLPNVWVGVTAENQRCADGRVPILLEIPAVVRYVSVEPMLGPVDLYTVIDRPFAGGEVAGGRDYNVALPFLDWVICGGETGPGARFVDDTQWVEWARDLRDQCEAAGVSFFFKQMPGKKPIPADLMVRQWPTIT